MHVGYHNCVGRRSACYFLKVEGQQIVDVGVLGPLWEFSEDVAQPCERLDATGAAGSRTAVAGGVMMEASRLSV